MPALGAKLRQEGHDLLSSYIIRPDPLDPRLSQEVEAIDQTGAKIKTRVVVERPLTLYLNAQEIVTMMTIGDHPDYLALGYLLNQLMLTPEDDITGVDFDEELDVVVVRTDGRTNFEEKLKKRKSEPKQIQSIQRLRGHPNTWMKCKISKCNKIKVKSCKT